MHGWRVELLCRERARKAVPLDHNALHWKKKHKGRKNIKEWKKNERWGEVQEKKGSDQGKKKITSEQTNLGQRRKTMYRRS